jgi:prolyl-tRNA editing enzyme YbaK/EbsC (Cys-tRNA(Pro) deacylase)
VVTIDGRLVLACVRAGDHVDLNALGNELGGIAVDALPDELPSALSSLAGNAVPPLGKLFGMPLVVDEELLGCAQMVFRADDGTAYFDVSYDDFALQEQPVTLSFARAGELAEGRSERVRREAHSQR